MIPFLESSGGNCQDAVILVEEVAVRVKPRGACEGTEIEQLRVNLIQYSEFEALYYFIDLKVLLKSQYR